MSKSMGMRCCGGSGNDNIWQAVAGSCLDGCKQVEPVLEGSGMGMDLLTTTGGEERRIDAEGRISKPLQMDNFPARDPNIFIFDNL